VRDLHLFQHSFFGLFFPLFICALFLKAFLNCTSLKGKNWKKAEKNGNVGIRNKLKLSSGVFLPDHQKPDHP